MRRTSRRISSPLGEEGEVFDYDATVRPMADLPLLRPEMAAWPPWEDARDWLAANELFAAEVLDELEESGRLTAREVSAGAQVPWRSSGWNAGRNASMMLRSLAMRGEAVVVGHRGNHPVYAAAAGVLPDVEPVPLEEARAERDRRRLRALGIARASGTEIPGESIHVRDAGEPAVVEGLKGAWRVDPAYVEDDAFEPRVALLSPFDALVRDRVRMEQLFDFEYTLEMYKPADKRRWGYFALPILVGDRLVGKLDATADRKRGELVVDAVHRDDDWSARTVRAVDAEVEALADWLGLRLARQA